MITFCALLYGAEPARFNRYHKRLLRSIVNECEGYPKRFWLNQVGPPTRDLAVETGGHITDDPTNTSKYQVIAQTLPQIATPYICWLDDDSFFREGSDFGYKLEKRLRADPAHFLGLRLREAYSDVYERYARAQSWWRGRTPCQLAGQSATLTSPGAYWIAKVDTLREIGWPYPELRWRGGDRILGDAMWQAGYELQEHQTFPGVIVNSGPARNYHPLEAQTPWDAAQPTADDIEAELAQMSPAQVRRELAKLILKDRRGR
jgi:hypothetical protein